MKTRMNLAPILIVLVVAAMTLSACSDSESPTTTGDGDPSVTTQAPDTTQAPSSGSESGGSTGDAEESSPSTNTVLLVVIGIVLFVALISWLASRNRDTDGSSQPGETNQAAPAPPPTTDPTAYDDDLTVDTDDGTGATGAGPQGSPSA